MYKEVGISSDNVPTTLPIWYTERSCPTIVLLSDTMPHPLMYENFLSGLCERRLNIIGVYYLSHGKSPKVKMNYTMEDLLYNAYNATTYGMENYGDNIAMMGSSQNGILVATAVGRGTRLKAVFPYNIMLTVLKETMSLTKYPAWTYRFMGLIQWGFRAGGKLLPNYKVPGDAYLDYSKVFYSEQAKQDYLNDPMPLSYYPLRPIASLFNADLSCLENDSIQCPVILIIAKGDLPFSFNYTNKVLGLIYAPQKELLTLELNRHMIFNEDTDATTNALEPTLHKYLGQHIDNMSSKCYISHDDTNDLVIRGL